MFYKITTFLFLYFYVAVIYACGVPITGEEYDSLIELKIDDEIYMIKIPDSVNGGKFLSANLEIYEKLYDSFINVPLQMKKLEGMLAGEVFFYKDLNLTVELSVWWDGGACPIIGRKILKHNKSLQPAAESGG